MCRKFTPDELNSMDHAAKNDAIIKMQDRLDDLEHRYEDLMEQIRLANQQRYGRNTEKLNEIAGQLSFFNEAEANCDEAAVEPTITETVTAAMKPPRKPKEKGQREEDLKGFPRKRSCMMSRTRNLILLLVHITGKVCLTRSSGSCVLSRPDGSPKNMW